jgi:hypothetical protein
VEIRDEVEYFCVVAHEQVEFEDLASLKAWKHQHGSSRLRWGKNSATLPGLLTNYSRVRMVQPISLEMMPVNY